MLINARESMLQGDASILQAINILDRAQAKIVLVVDGQERLIGSVVDGDVRRALLRGAHLDTRIDTMMHRNPYVLPKDASRQRILQAMHTLEIKQVPLVDTQGAVVGIALHDALLGIQHDARPNSVVIMAGGKGTRLLPLTQNTPKPMVPLGGKPILEWILRRLCHHGFRDFTFAINYLGHIIEDYFNDGSAFGCRINYLREQEFLGTAGGLSLLQKKSEHPILVMNGDILANINFGDLVDFHTKGNYSATICARRHRTEIAFGVIESKNQNLTRIIEKPTYENLINAGIYTINSYALEYIPKKTFTDMPDLLNKLLEKKYNIGVFELDDEWVDIGRHDDLERVKRNFLD